jgi:hypothetical protein
MNRSLIVSLGAFVGAVAAFASTAGAFAQGPPAPKQPTTHKHNSNTLAKIGGAIQYTTRKDTEHASVDVHRALGKKSVVRNRHTGNNYVQKPSGALIFKSSTNPRVPHIHHYRHHHHKTK